jgi:class 3 adenylate cyclase
MAPRLRDRRRSGIFRPPAVRLPAVVESVLHAGITSTDRLVRRRQMFTNLVAYIAALNAVVHLITNAVHDFDGLILVNVYNLLMLAYCLANHRLHRFGDLVAAVALIVGIAVGHSLVVFALGTSSDLHFYFTLAGFSLFLVGVDNFRVFLALYGVGLAALLVAVLLAPEAGFVAPGDLELRHSLSFEAAMNAFVMIGALITIALFSLHRAEQRSEALLATILPGRIVERLRAAPDLRIADRVGNCTVLFVDFVGFTDAARDCPPYGVVAFLDGVFSALDAASARLGVEKIKTMGDSYMAAGGLQGEAAAGARAVGRLALECLDIVAAAPELDGHRMAVRIGIHSGPVTAGVIGDARIAYDVWGATVNAASRMESTGEAGRVHVTEEFRALAGGAFAFEPRGEVEIRGVGPRRTWFLVAAAEEEKAKP